MEPFLAKQFYGAMLVQERLGGVTLDIEENQYINRYYLDLVFRHPDLDKRFEHHEYSLPDTTNEEDARIVHWWSWTRRMTCNPFKDLQRWHLCDTKEHRLSKYEYYAVQSHLDEILALCEASGIRFGKVILEIGTFEAKDVRYGFDKWFFHDECEHYDGLAEVTLPDIKDTIRRLRIIFDEIDQKRVHLYNKDVAKLCDGILGERSLTNDLTDTMRYIQKILKYSNKLSDFADQYLLANGKNESVCARLEQIIR